MTAKPVSSLSATMIGHGQSEAQRQALVQQNYRQEAQKISQYISTLHPARRQEIMQIQYPSTIQKLSSGNSQQHSFSSSSSNFTNTNSSTSSLNPHKIASTSKRIESEKEFFKQRSEEIKAEYSLNDRKKRYNRSCGTHAVVSDILQGTAPSTTMEPLFPQKANHQQVLMITGKLTMPDANQIPPDVPRSKKWLGNEQGWQK